MTSTGSELVHELLEVAGYLVQDRSGRAAQLNARRRRAVSTAYYALFHALSSLCADVLAGRGSDEAVHTIVYRALGHSEVKATLESRELSEGNPTLRRVSEALNNLQEQREAADYAPFHFAIGQAEAHALIGLARDAIGLLDDMDSGARRKLAVLLLAKSRPVQKRR